MKKLENPSSTIKSYNRSIGRISINLVATIKKATIAQNTSEQVSKSELRVLSKFGVDPALITREEFRLTLSIHRNGYAELTVHDDVIETLARILKAISLGQSISYDHAEMIRKSRDKEMIVFSTRECILKNTGVDMIFGDALPSTTTCIDAPAGQAYNIVEQPVVVHLDDISGITTPEIIAVIPSKYKTTSVELTGIGGYKVRRNGRSLKVGCTTFNENDLSVISDRMLEIVNEARDFMKSLE